jgi:hypothetical protein
MLLSMAKFCDMIRLLQEEPTLEAEVGAAQQGARWV